MRQRNEEFVGRVSHKLKTPLTWVLGYAEISPATLVSAMYSRQCFTLLS